jgi:hypothetical protein
VGAEVDADVIDLDAVEDSDQEVLVFVSGRSAEVEVQVADVDINSEVEAVVVSHEVVRDVDILDRAVE